MSNYDAYDDDDDDFDGDSVLEAASDVDSNFADSPADGYFSNRLHPQDTFVESSTMTGQVCGIYWYLPDWDLLAHSELHADSSVRGTQKLERRQSINRDLHRMRSLRMVTRPSQLLPRRGHLRRCLLTTQTLHQTTSLPPRAGLALTGPHTTKQNTPVGTHLDRSATAAKQRILTPQASETRMRCAGLLEIAAIHSTLAFRLVPLGLLLGHLHHGVADMSSRRP